MGDQFHEDPYWDFDLETAHEVVLSLQEREAAENFFNAGQASTSVEQRQLQQETQEEEEDGEGKIWDDTQVTENEGECCAMLSTGPEALTTEMNLHQHQRVHTGEAPHICKWCGISCRSSSTLIEHERSHTGEKPYKCEVCERSFSRKFNLARHRETHTKKKPDKCSECEQGFQFRIQLNAHRRTHEVERTYKCSNCHKDFTCLFDLFEHNSMHTEEGPYKCSECENSFRCNTSLMEHQRIHRRGEPDFGLSHASEQSLVEHNVTQPEKKHFVCSKCHSTFGCSGSLGLHQLKHKQETS